MIAHLIGTVLYGDEESIVVLVSGVGYRVRVPYNVISSLKEGQNIELFTHLAVRENSMDLYGFLTREEVSFFELLTKVSGIGPKTALGILGVAPPETLAEAILSGETSYLTKVSGIGRKNAQKIVLELKDKIGAGDGEIGGNLKEDSDVVEALRALGYSHKEARYALQNISNDAVGTTERIKEALKYLGSKNA